MRRHASISVGHVERALARAFERVSSSARASSQSTRGFAAAAAAAATSSPAPTRPAKQIRNVAVVAHVDHGKTTLVNQLLKAGGIEIKGDEDRLLDSLELESERGITIMSKATRIDWGDHQLNIVDTPGHQDFGGEVERVLSMVDGALVLVDALEGVRPQTKWVFEKGDPSRARGGAQRRACAPAVVEFPSDAVRDAMRWDGMQWDAMQRDATRCNAMQSDAKRCTTATFDD